jgi:hypothetical protein
MKGIVNVAPVPIKSAILSGECEGLFRLFDRVR